MGRQRLWVSGHFISLIYYPEVPRAQSRPGSVLAQELEAAGRQALHGPGRTALQWAEEPDSGWTELTRAVACVWPGVQGSCTGGRSVPTW